jgi:Calcineurin-like phosphoesterase
MALRRAALIATALAVLAAGCGKEDYETGDSESERAPAAQTSKADETKTVAVAADIGMQRAGRATFEAMAAARPDAHLLVGDLSYAGPDSAEPFCRMVQGILGDSTPIEIVSGNHEEDSGEDGRIADYAACLPDKLGAQGEYARQYYFDLGDKLARFILISPDLTIDGKHYFYGSDDDGADTPQMAWLKRAIDDARAKDIRWVIVGMHKPCISIGEYYCDVYQEAFTALIDKKVDLVLSGHEHSYQRSGQLAAGRPGCREAIVDSFDEDCLVDKLGPYERGQGTIFVITGHGGGELYDVHRDDPEAGYFARAMGANNSNARHGFSLLTLSPQKLELRAVGSSDGTFEDSFAIE